VNGKNDGVNGNREKNGPTCVAGDAFRCRLVVDIVTDDTSYAGSGKRELFS
jgi:hypothetical protein